MSQYSQWSAEEEEILRAENTKILHRLQSSLAQVLGLNVGKKQQVLSPLYQILIYGIVVLPQLRQFWDTFQSELAAEGPYTASIGGRRMKLSELQDDDKQAIKLRSEGLPEGWKDIEQVLHYQGLPYVPKVICLELINKHHNEPLAGHFGIEKTRELITRNYYWPTLQRDVKAYVKGCDICLALKVVCYKPYGDLQLLLVPTHR